MVKNKNSTLIISEHFDEFYVYSINKTHIQLLGRYKSVEEASLKFPTAQIKTLEESINFNGWRST